MAMERPTVTLPAPNPRSTWGEEWERLTKLVHAREGLSIWKPETGIQVQTTGIPQFMVMPLSDLHIGSEGTDYIALKNHLDAMKEYPIYTILLGDLGDFFSPKIIPQGMAGDVVPPDAQAMMAKRFFEEHRDSILAVVNGNHDGFVEGASGFDIYRYLAEDLGIPLVEAGGIVNLNVNDQHYRINPYHKIAKFNSSFNTTHAGKQAMRLSGHRDVDVVMSGHTHLGGYEQSPYGDRVITVVQDGTFKTDDKWGKNEGFVQRPQVFFPVLAFSGDKHQISVIPNVEEAVNYLDLTGSLWRSKAVGLLGVKSESSNKGTS